MVVNATNTFFTAPKSSAITARVDGLQMDPANVEQIRPLVFYQTLFGIPVECRAIQST
jgi:hypothetical protein